MRTAVDSSILLDVLGADPIHGERSREALRAAYRGGALIACEVVWAEVRAHFTSENAFDEALGALGMRFDTTSPAAAALAGRLWQLHRRRRGARGAAAARRIVADFLVGAHARLQSDALLTRDRGFYRAYFSGLRVLDPTRRGALRRRGPRRRRARAGARGSERRP